MLTPAQLADRGVEVLNATGLGVFGMAAPMLAKEWVDGDVSGVSSQPNEMALRSVTDSWRAPIAGVVQKIEDAEHHRKTLLKPDGSTLREAGILLSLHPLAYLRLRRLVAQLFQVADPTRPERDQGFPLRPVPKHFFFEGAVDSTDVSGNILPGDAMTQSGLLRVFDESGFPIDALFVLEMFYQILDQQPVLQAHPIVDAPVALPTTQLHTLRNNFLSSGSSAQFVRLAEFSGQPYSGAHLNGLVSGTPSNAALGFFQLNTSGGAAQISLAPASASFSAAERRLLQFGPSTFGTMAQSFTPPAVPAGITLRRDFFDLRVVELEKYIIGEPNTGYKGTQAELRPSVRVHEPLQLLADGNDVLAAASAALAGTTTESLCVAQTIASDFTAPTTPGTAARWPLFPGDPAAPGTAAAGPLPIDLRDSFNATAAYFDDGAPATANIDIVLTLQNLPVNAAVYAFPRRFLADARIDRGDGAGGVVRADGGITLLFKDPFALREPGESDSTIVVPAEAVLMVDVIIVKRTNEHRIYGNVRAAVQPATTATPDNVGTNTFNAAARRGVSKAGVLDLGVPFLGSLPTSVLDGILTLTGEVQPRDASRFPTMARREMVVAGLAAGQWRSVLSAGRLAAETLGANQKLGSPGKLGGRESSAVGVATTGGQLAYDLARSAFRRTSSIVERLEPLSTATWAVPGELAAGGAGAGSFVGAVLQNIAPFCETPELHLIEALVTPSEIPETFDAFVDWLKGKVNAVLPSGTPQRARIINELDTRLDSLKDNTALATSDKERLYNEIRREVMSAVYGRRDTQWSVHTAIKRANHFIYIESPGFAPTQKEYDPPESKPDYAVDLLKAIEDRLTEQPGLHVIICTPKYLDYGRGYAPFAAREVHERFEKIRAFTTADSRTPRIAAFHPIGFPGRPSVLQSHIVVVDDVFAVIGASAFRRRGLTFDGSTDLAFTDLSLRDGRSAAISEMRRRVMAERLGVQIPGTGQISNPNFARLKDGVESFHLVRDILLAGGLGKIAPLWNGKTPGVPTLPPDSVSEDLANPDGHEFNFTEALAVALFSKVGF